MQVYSHWVQFYARAQRIWQSPFVIINPQTGNGAGVWMTSCPKEMACEFEDFKNTAVEIGPWSRVVGDSTIESKSWVFSDFCRQRWIGILNITRCAERWGGVSTVSLQKTFKNCVSLIVSMNWSPEINERVRTWTTESACICICLFSPVFCFYICIRVKYN